MAEHDRWSVFAELRSLESAAPSWLASWKGDGILTRSGSPEMLAAVAHAGVPTVELRATRTPYVFPFVGVDNVALGQLAAEHLVDRGFKHFGVFELSTESFFEERRDSFVEAVQTAGHQCAHFVQEPGREQPRQWERQQSALQQWVKKLPKPCGILACTDQLGFWLLEACREANVSVPENVAVLGVENDDTLASISSPPLSSVRLGGSRIGHKAASILDDMMNGGQPPSEPTLIAPTSIVSRQSTDIVAVEDASLATALRYIRLNATKSATVTDVVREAAVSRSHLERLMKQHIGRTPRQEIERVRMERACTLLEDTDLTLADVAVRSGYENAQRLCERFRKMFGVTPGRWRQQ